MKNLKLSGGLFLLAGAQFLFLNSVAQAIYPNFNIATNALSDMGVYPATSLLWNFSLLAAGVLVCAGAAALFDYGREQGLLFASLFLAGLGFALGALFNQKDFFAIHFAAVSVAFLLGGLAVLFSYRLVYAPFGYFCGLLGVLSLASFLYLTSLEIFPPANGIENLGLVEWFIVLPQLLWLVGFGAHLMAAREVAKTRLA